MSTCSPLQIKIHPLQIQINPLQINVNPLQIKTHRADTPAVLPCQRPMWVVAPAWPCTPIHMHGHFCMLTPMHACLPIDALQCVR